MNRRVRVLHIVCRDGWVERLDLLVVYCWVRRVIDEGVLTFQALGGRYMY